MDKAKNLFTDLIDIKIQLVRIWHRHGADVLMYRQEHNPTEQELRAIEIAFAEDHDENLDSLGTEYQGFHTIGELLSFKSIDITVGNDAMTKAINPITKARLDYDGDPLDEDLDADDVLEAQTQHLRYTRM